MADSKKSQIDITAFLYCVQRTLGRKPDIQFTRIGQAFPELANPYRGNPRDGYPP
jgi:hypothetical protein